MEALVAFERYQGAQIDAGRGLETRQYQTLQLQAYKDASERELAAAGKLENALNSSEFSSAVGSIAGGSELPDLTALEDIVQNAVFDQDLFSIFREIFDGFDIQTEQQVRELVLNELRSQSLLSLADGVNLLQLASRDSLARAQDTFRSEIGSVPEPGTFGLLGLGLMGLALARRKMDKSATT